MIMQKVRNHPGIYAYETKHGKRYAVSTTASGRQKTAQGFKTIAEAEEAKDKIRGNGNAPASMTVAEFLTDHWFPTFSGAENSTRSYRGRIKVVNEIIGHVKLTKLDALDLERMKVALKKRGLNPTTCHSYFMLVRHALGQAVRWRLLSVNPASRDYVDAPSRTERKPPVVDMPLADLVEALQRLFRAADNHGYGLMIELTANTGMRAGEVFGLEWKNVDFGTRVLRVTRASTKTDTGAREIALSEPLVEKLRQHRLEQMKQYAELGSDAPSYVFTRPKGGRWTQGTFHRHWERIRQDADLPGFHFHDLRHVQATLMMRGGVNPRIVQQRLGHADVSTTLGIYSHTNVEDQRQAADMVTHLLSKEAK